MQRILLHKIAIKNLDEWPCKHLANSFEVIPNIERQTTFDSSNIRRRQALYGRWDFSSAFLIDDKWEAHLAKPHRMQSVQESKPKVALCIPPKRPRLMLMTLSKDLVKVYICFDMTCRGVHPKWSTTSVVWVSSRKGIIHDLPPSFIWRCFTAKQHSHHLLFVRFF